MFSSHAAGLAWRLHPVHRRRSCAISIIWPMDAMLSTVPVGCFSLVGRRARAIDYGDIIAYYDNLDRSMEARAPVPPRPRVLSPQR